MHVSASPSSFGARLKAARDRRDMSAAHLSKLAGIEQSHLSHFETGTRQPNADNIRKLAVAIDITADFLLGLSDETHRINGVCA